MNLWGFTLVLRGSYKELNISWIKFSKLDKNPRKFLPSKILGNTVDDKYFYQFLFLRFGEAFTENVLHKKF